MRLTPTAPLAAALLMIATSFAADKNPQPRPAPPGKAAPVTTETTVNLTVTGMT